jgi:tetratricopeptide (TPR) repeat protein
MNNLAALLRDRGNLDAAERLHEQAIILQRELFGPRHATIAASLNNLGRVSASRGDYARAEALFRQSLEMNRAVHSEDHVHVATTHGNLATVLFKQGKADEAEPYFREAVTKGRELLGRRHPLVGGYLLNFVKSHSWDKDDAEPHDMFEEAVAIYEEVFGHTSVMTQRAIDDHVAFCMKREEFDRAERHLAARLEQARTSHDPSRDRRGLLLSLRGQCLSSLGRHEDAQILLREAIELLTETRGFDAPETVVARNALSDSRIKQDGSSR